MGYNVDKLREIAQPRSEEARAKAQWRRENRGWLRMSQHIALLVLDHLHRTGITQKELAERMGVTPQQVARLLKGSENMTLETISKIQKALDITLVTIETPRPPMQVISFTPSTCIDNHSSYSRLSKKNAIDRRA